MSESHSHTACRTPRHTRVQHLVTADETSLTELEALLVTLPICSTGRVFIEVPDASWIVPLNAPVRMTVTWLDRSRRSGAPGTGRSCSPGEAVSRAVTAWAGEMLCDGEGEGEGGTRAHLLGGFLGTADIVDDLVGRCGMPADAIVVPERFGLLRTR